MRRKALAHHQETMGMDMSQERAPPSRPKKANTSIKLATSAVENVTNDADLRDAAREVANQNEEFIGDRRGVVTDGQVHDLAAAIGDEGAYRLVEKMGQGQRL
jgi:hypothetical protein